MKCSLLADIGNTHFHIYTTDGVEHLSHSQAIEKYQDKALVYICVNTSLSQEIAKIKKWKNISSLMELEGAYDTMGVDRKALCLSHDNGIFIDAGSAITVDVMLDGVYQGGFILLGIQAYLASYASISEVLDVTLETSLNVDTLPCTTKEGISYGIIASIKALIDKHSHGKTRYFTGGDGAFLSTFFEDAIYDESLVFQGVQKVIKELKIC